MKWKPSPVNTRGTNGRHTWEKGWTGLGKPNNISR